MAKQVIKCQRPDYNVTFQEDDCSGNLLVRNLEISRMNFGKIRFLSSVKLENVNLDDVVFINHKEVILYPEEKCGKASLIGEGLNCSAEVTLERVWPSSRNVLLTEKDFEDKLRKVCDDQDAEFISYCHQTGHLKFKVKHFSKYSCNIEEDEDEEQVDSSSNASGIPKPPSQLGLGGISLKEFQMHHHKEQLPPHSNPDSKKMAQCNASQVGSLTTSKKNVHLGDGDSCAYTIFPDEFVVVDIHEESGKSVDASKPFRFTDNQQKVREDKFVAIDFHEVLEEPEDASTPISFTDYQHRNKSLSLPFTSTPPTSTKMKRGPYASVLQSQSSGSLRSKLMKRMLLQEEFNDHDELIQQATPVPTHATKSKSLFKDTILSGTPKYSSDHSACNKPTRDLNVNPKMAEESRYSSSTAAIAAPFGVQEETGFSSVRKPGFEDLFSRINPREKVTHSKLFGAPRVCFSKSGHFITVQNQLTSSGFKGHAKISVFESYSEKQEAFPFSNSYRSTLKSQLMLHHKNDGKVLFKEHADIVKEQLANTSLPGSQKCLKSELLIWELCDILWPEEVDREEEIYDEGFLLSQRRKLSEWLIANGSFIFGKAYDPQDNSIFGLLKKGKLEEACEKALSEGNQMLAVVLACKADSILDCTDFKAAFQFFPPQSLDVMNLINGTLAVEELTADFISSMSSNNWLQYYALYLWYYGSCKSMAVDHAVRNFEMMMRDMAGGDDDYVLLPRTECSSAATMCVHLLKLYSCTGYPVKKLLVPRVWTNDTLDYKLSWLLMKNLEAIGYIPENEVYSNVSVAFVEQLEQIEMFEWAVFISKCNIPPEPEDDDAAEKAAGARDLHEMRLLERYVDNGHDTLEKETFLTVELGVDERVIYTIKGQRASARQRYDQMIGYFCKVGQFQKAFNVLTLYLNDYGVDVVSRVSGDYPRQMLKHLLTLYPFRKNITGWDIHGKLMVNFFRLSQVKKILGATCFSSTSHVNEQEYLESALLGFLKAIIKYEPKSERERAFLLELMMTAQKSAEMMLVDKKVNMSTKDKIKEALLRFLSIPVPKDYFEDCIAFINKMIIMGTATAADHDQNQEQP